MYDNATTAYRTEAPARVSNLGSKDTDSGKWAALGVLTHLALAPAAPLASQPVAAPLLGSWNIAAWARADATTGSA